MNIQLLEKDGNVINTVVVAQIDDISLLFPGLNWREVIDPLQEFPLILRHISVGAFYDRFKEQKFSILASQDLGVQALIKDSSVRKFIDLDRPDLPAALDMLIAAGFSIDKENILNAPIQENEKP